ncbi:hypothetical protein PybrP1_009103 [[Pythium] brassicae (nom. inval.)]|nr:hypothetical protein PybrP1_009103 [[Pythium] brassicae (nom. inval.)]
MEEDPPVVEQENDVGDARGESDRRKDPAERAAGEDFDPTQFASLLQNELIAYNFSWEPLLKALQALGLSVARQQRVQKDNNDSVEDAHAQVNALRGQLSQVQREKDDMGSTLASLQEQMAKMQTHVGELQEQQQQVQDRERRDNSADANSTGDQGAMNEDGSFVTTKDLAKAKRDLSKQLRRSLTEAFGDEDVGGGHGDDALDDDADATGNSADTEGEEDPLAAVERASLKRPGAPFASDAVVKQEMGRLQQLQDALSDKLAAHEEQIAALTGRVGDLDVRASDRASQLAGEGSETPRHAATDASSNSSSSSALLSPDALLKELSELRAAQDAQKQLLRDQQRSLGKNASDLKALAQSLDDLATQQQAAALMFAASAPAPSQPASGDNQGDKRRTSDAGPMQLDLSLVFTKIADLRRSTDASLESLQKHISDVSSVSDSQQAQLDALRNGLVFNEHQRLHMIEARLAMQKELLERNQTHQDRAKPQLAEWRKALELNEEKLAQGLCDEEIVQELQQLQRHYRRAYLAFSPLINSPLTIAESLQELAEEVKQFQNGAKAGVVPLRAAVDSAASGGGGGGAKRNDREDDFTRKLRFLDEEVDATLQVNVVTEKKNDPLIKSLDAMREKLESLSSMWHRNFTQRKRASRGLGDAQGTITDSDCTPRAASSDYDGLREVELRLMGAVRRLGIVEEDVERLNALSAINTSEVNSAARAAAMAAAGGARAKHESEELSKLRNELFAEIAKVAALLGTLQSSSIPSPAGSTSLVPSSEALQLTGSRVAGQVSQNDLVKELYSQMKGRELDGRFQELRDDEVQKQLYDSFLKEVTKKVTQAVLNADKAGGGRLGGGTAVANNPINYRLMLENFTQKVEDRLEDAHESTAEDLQRLKKELLDQLRLKIELALRELRSELMLLPSDNGESTAMGTKPVMCVACSRPVPVSSAIREAGSLPPAELVQAEHSPPHNHGAVFPLDNDYERNDDEFVYRAGFRMPVNDRRKTMTLPFLPASMRNKMVLSKPEGRRKRPMRQSHNASRVDNVIREAMELDRSSRLRGSHEPQT